MPDTPKEARFRALVRSMLQRDVKPTPKAIAARQRDEKFVNWPGSRQSGPSLSGSLSTIRIEEFERAGWVMGHNGKWRKP
jgi:hypothetical protein